MADPITALPTPPSTSDPDNFDSRADAFLAALVTFVTETNAVAAAMNLNATSGSSATSNSIGTGAKTFTADTGKSWLGGMFIVIADNAAPSTNSMLAQVTSYNSGTGELIVDVKAILGSGTKTAWTISQTANPIPLDGSVSATSLANDAVLARSLADSSLGLILINGTLAASVSSNALTIAIKTNAGADPSSTDPVLVIFRNSTLTTGSIVVRSVTAATSVVVSNGSSLGTTASVSALLKVLAIDNAGTVELAVCNGYGNNVVNEGGVISTTAEGGAGAADSADAIYSTTARSNVACRVIGSINITPGASFAWSASPTTISNGVQNTQLAMPGMLCAPKAVTSGSSYTFTVPSWAKKAIVTFTGISTTGTTAIYIRLGDAGGIENSGYNGAIATLNSASSACVNIASAFNITSGAVAASNYSGKLTLNLQNPYTNTWVAEGGAARNDNTTSYLVRGDKSLTTQLTTIELGTSDAFDGSGEWNVLFE